MPDPEPEYLLEFLPVTICPCAPGGANALTLPIGAKPHQQRVKHSETVAKEGGMRGFQPPKSFMGPWPSILCCNCKKDQPPTHLLVSQVIGRDKVVLDAIECQSIGTHHATASPSQN